MAIMEIYVPSSVFERLARYLVDGQESLDALCLIMLMGRGPLRILRTNLCCEQSYRMLIDAYVVHN